MKILRDLLEKASALVKRTPLLKRLSHLLEAVDEFFFGTDKVTAEAPHIMDSMDMKRFMSLVIVALIPATLAGIYFYGLRVIAVIAVSYTFGGLTEVIFSMSRKKPVHEGFLVTGLIFPLILPPTVPLWMVAVGVIFGVFFGKEVFGGTGRNIFNPALAGRVFLSLAFPETFTSMWQAPLFKGLGGFVRYTADAVTSATPLINFKAGHILTGMPSLLIGSTPGSIGETFRIGIIAGGLFLIFVRAADWRVPLSYISTVLIFSFFAHGISSEHFAPPLFQLLTGGLLFGAFFMATDPVTLPLTFEGKWIFGAFAGLLTVLIRSLTGFVEGVMFAILLMNAMAPLIDTIVIKAKFRNINK